jgi:hypothetical protein
LSLLLLFNQGPSGPPVVASRFILPLGGTVTLGYPWGQESANLTQGVVSSATQHTGTVTLAFPWGPEATNPVGGQVPEQIRITGVVGKVDP